MSREAFLKSCPVAATNTEVELLFKNDFLISALTCFRYSRPLLNQLCQISLWFCIPEVIKNL